MGKNCTRTTKPPEGYLSSAFPAAEDSKAYIFSSDPSPWRLMSEAGQFYPKIRFLPNMDKSLEKKNQAIPAVNNKAWPSTFLPVHM